MDCPQILGQLPVQYTHFLILLGDSVTNMVLYMSAATSDHIQNTVAGN